MHPVHPDARGAARQARCLLLAALFSLSMAPALAGSGHGHGREVVHIHTRDESVIRQLAVEHGHMRVDRAKGVVTVELEAGGRGLLLAKGLRASIDPVLTELVNERPPLQAKQAKGIAGFPCYRTVAETRARLDALVELYPHLAVLVDLGPSWEGLGDGLDPDKRLRLIRLGNRDIVADKPVLFAMTAIHAREYTTAELGLRFAEHLLQGYGSDPEATWILDHHEVHLLVQANPDGRRQAETGLSWRKNTNQGYCGSTSTSRGADLNRNFPFAWGTVPNGSSPNVCSATYRGPLPASEPETQAVVNYTRALIPSRRPAPINAPANEDTRGIFLDIHSFSELVLWPWGITTDPAPNAEALERLGRRFAWFNGYKPEASVGLYPTDGTTDDFAYGELGLPAYTFELGTAFFQACSVFEGRILQDNLQALMYAAKAVRAPYRLPFGPEALQVSTSPDLPVAGETVRVSARIDDGRSSTRFGSVSVQPISAASAYLSTPPWLAGAEARAMAAVDGAFDSVVETVEVQLEAPAGGQHLVYVQGTDADGHSGPVGAAFLRVYPEAELAQVCGKVRSRRDGGALAEALVEFDGGFLAELDAGARYTRRLPVATATVRVTAPGHEPLELAGLSLQAGLATPDIRNFELFALCPLLATNSESGPGTGAAAWTTELASSAGTPWAIVEPGTVNSSRAWHDSPGGNYANNIDTLLLSPVFSTVGFEAPRLRLRSRCDTEAGYDFGLIQVRRDPSQPWTTVYSCDGDPAWRELDFALPQLEGAAAAQIRFRLTSDGSVNRDGWYIDGIVVEAAGGACRAQQPPLLLEDGFEAC